ncbi:MAG: hypothetical protein QOD99_1391 [Chthoniobacter sp.]|jgi:hypothetical protein|nr:hypothetical protein [Chthoniobacter sp.]
MKRIHQSQAGSTAGELLGTISYIAFTLLTIWGIGWSFYRHGPIHGVASVMIPPYAWYRGVAAIWDTPAWRERYDVRTEQLAIMIVNSVNNDPNWQIQSREYAQTIKDWIRHVPQSERQKLKDAARDFGFATTDYCQRYLLAMLDGDTSTHPEQAASVQQHVAGFHAMKGFDSAWQHLVQDTNSLDDVLTSLKRGQSNPNLQLQADESQDNRPKTENAIRAMIQVMSEKIQRTIDELFAAS